MLELNKRYIKLYPVKRTSQQNISMKETTISYKIKKRLESYGYVVIRLRATSDSGWPDLLVLEPGGRAFFIEVKTPEGKLSAMQKAKIAILRALLFDVKIISSENEI
jgi:Holliday junction resolvase-like predicted endonuclease